MSKKPANKPNKTAAGGKSHSSNAKPTGKTGGTSETARAARTVKANVEQANEDKKPAPSASTAAERGSDKKGQRRAARSKQSATKGKSHGSEEAMNAAVVSPAGAEAGFANSPFAATPDEAAAPVAAEGDDVARGGATKKPRAGKAKAPVPSKGAPKPKPKAPSKAKQAAPVSDEDAAKPRGEGAVRAERPSQGASGEKRKEKPARAAREHKQGTAGRVEPAPSTSLKRRSAAESAASAEERSLGKTPPRDASPASSETEMTPTGGPELSARPPKKRKAVANERRDASPTSDSSETENERAAASGSERETAKTETKPRNKRKKSKAEEEGSSADNTDDGLVEAGAATQSAETEVTVSPDGASEAAPEPGTGAESADADEDDEESVLHVGEEVPEDEDEEQLSEEEENRRYLKGIIEALLFASDKPLTPRELARAARIDKKRTLQLLVELRKEYKHRGVNIVEVSGGVVLRSNPLYGAFVQKALALRPVKLSRAQLETLAIVAYRQPITRPEIDDIRGVDSGQVLKGLADRDLIKMVGKKDEAGRPMLYGTTDAFLELFNLESLKGLPSLREFTELSEDSREKFAEATGETIPGPVTLDEEAAGEETEAGSSSSEVVEQPIPPEDSEDLDLPGPIEAARPTEDTLAEPLADEPTVEAASNEEPAAELETDVSPTGETKDAQGSSADGIPAASEEGWEDGDAADWDDDELR